MPKPEGFKTSDRKNNNSHCPFIVNKRIHNLRFFFYCPRWSSQVIKPDVAGRMEEEDTSQSQSTPLSNEEQTLDDCFFSFFLWISYQRFTSMIFCKSNCNLDSDCIGFLSVVWIVAAVFCSYRRMKWLKGRRTNNDFQCCLLSTDRSPKAKLAPKYVCWLTWITENIINSFI